MAADVRLAPRWVEQRRQDLHRRRFARSIGSDKAKQVTRGQIELNGLNGELLAIFFRQVMRFDHGRRSSVENRCQLSYPLIDQ